MWIERAEAQDSIRCMARLPNMGAAKFLAADRRLARDRASRGKMACMPGVANSEMDVEEFLVWAEGREGRWELRDGEPVLMAPERAAHALTKFAAQKALRAAINAPACPAACSRTA